MKNLNWNDIVKINKKDKNRIDIKIINNIKIMNNIY